MKRQIVATLSAVFSALLICSLLAASPAEAAAKPGKVGLIWFTKSGLKGKKAFLRFQWDKPKNAKTYEVFVHTSYSGVLKAKVTKKTKKPAVVISNLKPNTDYYIQVRAVNGKKKGSKSARQAHRTLRTVAATTLSPFRVMTYNVCTRVCDSKHPWSARKPLVERRLNAYRPDIVAMQEADSNFGAIPTGYTDVYYKSAKRLLIRDARMELATGTNPADRDVKQPGELVCLKTGQRACYLQNGAFNSKGQYDQSVKSGKRYAVMAEVVDKVTGQHFVVVNIHTTVGNARKQIDSRRMEIERVINVVDTEFNPGGLPTLYVGDFNSHRNRGANGKDDSVGKAFSLYGYDDAFQSAEQLRGHHRNSYNDFVRKPKIGTTWGDHVDHLYVVPQRARVTYWRQAEDINAAGTKYGPLGSDHSPLIFDVRLAPYTAAQAAKARR